MNLTPYQNKRNKTFPDNFTSEDAITQEIVQYWRKGFPVIFNYLKTNKRLLDQIVLNLAPLIAPEYAFDQNLPWTITRIQNLIDTLLILEEIQKESGEEIAETKRISLLPKHYQKHIKRLLTTESTRDKLSKSLNSRKRAKKILRITHKRLGIYKKRKPPFSKILKIESN